MRIRAGIRVVCALTVVMTMTDRVAGQSGPYAPQRFELGPVPPTVDLRNMVRAHIVRRCCELLDRAAATRSQAIGSGRWQPWRDAVRRAVLDGLGEMPFGPDGPPLNVRAVSRHERKGYVIENVLFESLPGWDVNASVYLPSAGEHPPPWPAIVVPVGHSGKQMESYQIPAQVFARLGYVAVTFDPPGMAGEKRTGNDHFSDGVRCYLTGYSSNRYFVIDAIRCIDYLATRKDVDMRNGVGMTGVSGGGTTTMFATLLDGRIRASGPSCCAVPNAYHPVLDGYAPCAETLAAGRFADGLDDVDLLVAAMPTPLLLMAGPGTRSSRSRGPVRLPPTSRPPTTRPASANDSGSTPIRAGMPTPSNRPSSSSNGWTDGSAARPDAPCPRSSGAISRWSRPTC